MASRRGRGESAGYKDGDRWRGAISLGYDDEGRRIRKKVSGRTKAEVLGKLRELQRQLDAGAPPPDDRMTVGQFPDQWVSVSLPGHVANSTLDDYADTVRLHLRPVLGRRPLTKLSVIELDALWKAKRDQGYSANSVRIMRTVLRKALSQAEREGSSCATRRLRRRRRRSAPSLVKRSPWSRRVDFFGNSQGTATRRWFSSC